MSGRGSFIQPGARHLFLDQVFDTPVESGLGVSVKIVQSRDSQ